VQPKKRSIAKACTTSPLGCRVSRWPQTMGFSPGHVFPLFSLELWLRISQTLQEDAASYAEYLKLRTEFPSIVISATGSLNERMKEMLFGKKILQDCAGAVFLDFLDLNSSYERTPFSDRANALIRRINEISQELIQDQRWALEASEYQLHCVDPCWSSSL
jgi:hypothetical protein